MKDFMNCINPRIMYLDLDTASLIEHLVHPPELHLLIGFVSQLGNFLLDTWRGFDDWLKSINFIPRGYQGGGWDEKNANNVLEILNFLETNMLESSACLIPIV